MEVNAEYFLPPGKLLPDPQIIEIYQQSQVVLVQTTSHPRQRFISNEIMLSSGYQRDLLEDVTRLLNSNNVLGGALIDVGADLSPNFHPIFHRVFDIIFPQAASFC